MMRPEVVNRREARHLPGDVYIGRPGPFGNPFTIGRDGTREEVIEQYRDWLAQHPELLDQLVAKSPSRLVCWCAPEACHGDILADELEARG